MSTYNITVNVQTLNLSLAIPKLEEKIGGIPDIVAPIIPEDKAEPPAPVGEEEEKKKPDLPKRCICGTPLSSK